MYLQFPPSLIIHNYSRTGILVSPGVLAENVIADFAKLMNWPEASSHFLKTEINPT